jgi:hypothetical protein
MEKQMETKLKNRNETLRAHVLHEQQALHRLREVPPAPPDPAFRTTLARERALVRLIAVLRAIIAVLEPLELVQNVGPDRPPLRRDEWDPPRV